MSRCLNESIGRKLYAYEAGLLGEAETEQFELHLLECEYCNSQVRALEQGARIIRHDSEVRKAVARMARPEPAAWYRTGIGRTALAIAALLVLIIARPWRMQTGETGDAYAASDRLVILRFDNSGSSTDESKDGEIVANLLNTDLVGATALPVVSDQRVQDITRRLQRESDDPATPPSNLEIAREAGARWLLTGAILKSDPEFAITMAMIDVPSGDIIASLRLDSWPKATLFDLVDSLSVLVRTDLGVSRAASSQQDRNICDVTTCSLEAYRYYLEGLDYYSQYYVREAVRSFHQAVQLDSTFAMAYYYLARLESRSYLDPAVRYADRATRKEQLYIASLKGVADGDVAQAIDKLQELVKDYPDEKEAWYLLAQYAFAQLRYEDVTRYATRAIALDPYFKFPYNLLAFAFDETGKLDSSRWAADTYVMLAPDEPLPYHTRGELLARHGHLKEAISSYDQALQIKRDFAGYATLLTKGLLEAYLREYDSANAIFNELAQRDQKRARSAARTSMAIVPILQGDFDRALGVLEDGIAADRLEQALAGRDGDRDYKYFLTATISLARDDPDGALQNTREALDIFNRVYPDEHLAYRYYLVQMLAEAGEWDEAQVVLDSIRPESDAPSIEGTAYWYGNGCLMRAEGKLVQARDSFKKAAGGLTDFHIEFMLARTLIDLGEYDTAVVVLERQVENYSNMKLRLPIWAVETHYLLARACEETGRVERALDQYREFLAYWGDSREGVESIADARRRLSRLKTQP